MPGRLVSAPATPGEAWEGRKLAARNDGSLSPNGPDSSRPISFASSPRRATLRGVLGERTKRLPLRGSGVVRPARFIPVCVGRLARRHPRHEPSTIPATEAPDLLQEVVLLGETALRGFPHHLVQNLRVLRRETGVESTGQRRRSCGALARILRSTFAAFTRHRSPPFDTIVYYRTRPGPPAGADT